MSNLEQRSFEVAKVAGGRMLRTRTAYAAAIGTTADVGDQDLDLRENDVAVLAAIAYHQPITRDGLKDIFGKEIGRDLIGRLQGRGLIGTGPRSLRREAPYTFVTTEQSLVAFDRELLQDLPDREPLEDAGVVDEAPQVDFGLTCCRCCWALRLYEITVFPQWFQILPVSFVDT